MKNTIKTLALAVVGFTAMNLFAQGPAKSNADGSNGSSKSNNTDNQKNAYENSNKAKGMAPPTAHKKPESGGNSTEVPKNNKRKQ